MPLESLMQFSSIKKVIKTIYHALKYQDNIKRMKMNF